ncbi:hypothetical protein Dimus_025701 [Dionaea muscipula]
MMKNPNRLLFIALLAPIAMLTFFFDLVVSHRPTFIPHPSSRLTHGPTSPSSEPPPPSPTFPRPAPPPLSLRPTPPPPAERLAYTPFKPSIAVIVAVLTTMFSVTFLLLLYAKHCKRGDGIVGYFGDATDLARGGGGGGGGAAASGRKNSGIDRAVIESLPVFRFASLSGEKDGLECAVCLNRFEPMEVLRLLPKCKHAFHVECVDTWLDAHSTCPLCRYRVDPEDVLLVETNHSIGFVPEEHKPSASSSDSTKKSDNEEPEQDQEQHKPSASSDSTKKSFADSIRRISGRHSYAGLSSSKAHPPAFRMSYEGPQARCAAAAKREAVAVGCFDRHRKDGMLLTVADRERRLDHRVIIAGEEDRSSDLQAANLLYLPRESVMNEDRRSSAASLSSKGDVMLLRGSQQRSVVVGQGH